MSKVNVAIIGCGTIANNAHIPSYINNAEVKIKYFCDIILERAQNAVDKYKCGRAIQDYHEILNDEEVEAVSICTPNNCHAQISIAFLRAGKHVLCEKPAARVLEEALDMQKAQHETGKILNIGVVNRFNKGVNLIKDIVDSGELGEIYHTYISFRAHRSIPGLGGAFTTKAIAGGGVLIDWGVHYIDIVMYCLGDPQPLTVSGKTFSKLGRNIENYTYKDMWAGPPISNGVYDVDDFVTALIRTESSTISLNGAWAQNIGQEETYIDFIGDKAGIRLQYGQNFKIYSTKNGMLTETTPSYNLDNHFQNEIDSFIRSIKTNEKLPSHIDNAIITAKLMQGIYDSSEMGREISFELED